MSDVFAVLDELVEGGSTYQIRE
ncbi:unnamed protein product [Victoria cruziana]